MSLETEIRHLADTTYKNNREIAEALNCSRRSVRRHAGSWESRVRKKTGEKIEQVVPARILLLDIETSPMEVYVWNLIGNKYISPKNIIKPWSILSWSAKWLFEPTVISQRVSGRDARDREDRNILSGMWDLLNEANIVVAHNGARFDIRRLNARFVAAGLLPPMPYRVIDTLRVARNRFDFPSYKLDEINKWLDLSPKQHSDFEMWVRCVHGDDEALETMKVYNESDVLVLEELYLALRPWIKSHPNIGLYINTNETVCTNCGNKDLEWKGFYFTPAGKYEAFRCTACGAIGRSRKSDLTKEEKDKLITSVSH